MVTANDVFRRVLLPRIFYLTISLLLAFLANCEKPVH
jgi:hypothetical protein